MILRFLVNNDYLVKSSALVELNTETKTARCTNSIGNINTIVVYSDYSFELEEVTKRLLFLDYDEFLEVYFKRQIQTTEDDLEYSYFAIYSKLKITEAFYPCLADKLLAVIEVNNYHGRIKILDSDFDISDINGNVCHFNITKEKYNSYKEKIILSPVLNLKETLSESSYYNSYIISNYDSISEELSII